MGDNPQHIENFLNRPPSWLMQRGMVVAFLFLTFIFVFAYTLKYNDVIKAEILITSKNPPVNLISKRNGRIVEANFRPGQMVRKNEILAIMENSSKHKDIYYLKSKLENDIDSVINVDGLFQNFPSDLELEIPIQISYQDYVSTFGKYLLYKNLDQEKLENENLNSQIEKLKKLIQIKQLLLSSSKRNLSITSRGHKRQSEIYDKGVISRQELDKSEQNLLSARNEVNKVNQELEQLYIDTLNLSSLSLKSFNKDIINSSVYYSELKLAKQELKGKINQWENMYVIKSPISGIITVFDIWNTNQNVVQGEHLITIVPEKSTKLIGKCKVPIKNSAKIKKQQNVIIKLDNYPYQEWGTLNGKVVSMSETPKKGKKTYYSVYVDISELRTSYDKEIMFKQEMYGSANIILEEISFMERIFYQFRGLWTNIQN